MSVDRMPYSGIFPNAHAAELADCIVAIQIKDRVAQEDKNFIALLLSGTESSSKRPITIQRLRAIFAAIRKTNRKKPPA